jgi:tellurite methyltransferase
MTQTNVQSGQANGTNASSSVEPKDDTFWSSYYKSGGGDNPLIYKVSSFTAFVTGRLRLSAPFTVLELGCGNGRDAAAFASLKSVYIGVDTCPVAVDRARQHLLPNVSFNQGNFALPWNSDALALPTVLKNVDTKKFDLVYSRFTLHSVTDEEENIVFDNVQRLLASGGWFCIEARSKNDPRYGKGKQVSPNAFVDTHFRRFLDLQETIGKLEVRGFTVVVACEEWKDANYCTDMAVVIRILCTKQ